MDDDLVWSGFEQGTESEERLHSRQPKQTQAETKEGTAAAKAADKVPGAQATASTLQVLNEKQKREIAETE